MSHKLNIAILCQYSFPEGMAPTTRIISYGKGLVRNGSNVRVIIYRPKILGEQSPVQGNIQGIDYVYSHVRDPRKSLFHKIFVDRPVAIIKAVRIIKQFNKKTPLDCILFSFDDPKFMLFFSFVFHFLGIRTGFIGDEFPEPIRRLKEKLPITYILAYKVAYHFISFRILMTEALKKFYDEKICIKPTFILSSILDEDRFIGIEHQEVQDKYMCYMGNMMLAKDNVDNIINAFALIVDEIQNINLHLFGVPNDRDEFIIRDLITSKHLENRVFLKGRISYEQVPQVLANAEVLVTSQPNTKRAEGGFPTKLGEYMMSHRPSVVTDVGEIHNYVQDGVTTFMVPPENPQAYADKLRYVLTHPDEAKRVSDNAYKYAMNNFGCKQVTKPLVKFLSNVNN